MAGKYLLTTLGCKVNQYESQQIREVLESCGLSQARPGDDPDIAVVNTCAVTVAASRKNRQAIRRVARGGRTPVIVLGCGATADSTTLARLEGVTAVVGHGTDVCADLRELISRHQKTGWPVRYRPTHSAVNAVHAVKPAEQVGLFHANYL